MNYGVPSVRYACVRGMHGRFLHDSLTYDKVPISCCTVANIGDSMSDTGSQWNSTMQNAMFGVSPSAR